MGFFTKDGEKMAWPINIDEYGLNNGRHIKEDNTTVNIADLLDGVIYTDTDGNFEMTIIEVLHVLVHQRKMHTVSVRKLTAQDGTLRIAIKANAKDVHIRINYSSEDFALFNSYVATSIVGGTVYTPFNRVTGTPSNLSCVVTQDPTTINGASARGQDFIGASGAVSVRAGGTGGGDIESIIKAGDLFVLELQRTETGTKYTGMILNLYER